MTKPNEYRETYVLARDMPYRNTGTATGGAYCSEGMLERGRVVWLQGDMQATDEDSQVSAYAEGVGFVLVTPRSIDRLR